MTNNIKHIVEQVLGQKINIQCEIQDPYYVDEITSHDELALIKHYLNNSDLITEDLIAKLVSKQLKKFPLAVEPNLPQAKTWSEYLHKLEQILEQIKYRKAHNYEFHAIMPTSQQLMQLQDECWQFTAQKNGAGNLSCFYNYFIEMSQAAGVTRFSYLGIEKFISHDHYISQINAAQRRAFYLQHEKLYQDYMQEGGFIAQGRSSIDATTISNVYYHKSAQLLFYHQYAKRLIVTALELEDYGQLPYAQRMHIWHLLQQYYPDNTSTDQASIFYKFTEYINARPGEFFNYFGTELPAANKVPPQMLHDIIKVAGLQSNYLVLLSRNAVDNWVPKRHFTVRWVRKYPLLQINTADEEQLLRPAGAIEHVRFLPNELPYAPGHGLSLCGDGLVDNRLLIAFEWNTPTDPLTEFDNWVRDIEKLFREMRFFLGETPINMFHNAMAYSTIHTTQHTHLIAATIEKFKIYLLPSLHQYTLPDFQAVCEIVQVGKSLDACYLRWTFNSLDNEQLLQFLLQLNAAIFKHFGGIRELDVHMQLFCNRLLCKSTTQFAATVEFGKKSNEQGDFIFIYEPHAFLNQLDNDRFYNPHNNIESPRRPQFLQPQGNDMKYFSANDPMAAGLEFCRKFFDDISRPGVYDFLTTFIRDYS